MIVRFPSGIELPSRFADKLIQDLLTSGWVAESTDDGVVFCEVPMMPRLARKRAINAFVAAELAIKRARGSLKQVQIVIPQVISSRTSLVGSVLREAKEAGWIDGWYYEATQTIVLMSEESP